MGSAVVGSLEVEVMDLTRIALCPQDSSPQIVKISEADGFVLDARFSNDFRLRKAVYDRLKISQAALPSGMRLCVFEAYRPLARQIAMWGKVQEEMRVKYPDIAGDAFIKLCENFIANPYDGIGSGHQACCAVDVSVCTEDGTFLDMGTDMHQFNEWTKTDVSGLSSEVRKNREMLVHAMEVSGFANYPAEWWHYSYGDHQWAWLTGRDTAIFGPIDI